MKKEQELARLIRKGNIFIYPTDTVYGIGCNALKEESVKKIKQMKGRDDVKPLSVIAPSKQWILNHTKASKELVEKYLPGPYTLLVEKKDSKFLSYVSPTDILGVRIPKHPFTGMIKKADVPFITTSANISGEKPPSKLEDISPELLKKADVIIDGGKLSGTPSTIILPDGKEMKR